MRSLLSVEQFLLRGLRSQNCLKFNQLVVCVADRDVNVGGDVVFHRSLQQSHQLDFKVVQSSGLVLIRHGRTFQIRGLIIPLVDSATLIRTSTRGIFRRQKFIPQEKPKAPDFLGALGFKLLCGFSDSVGSQNEVPGHRGDHALLFHEDDRKDTGEVPSDDGHGVLAQRLGSVLLL